MPTWEEEELLFSKGFFRIAGVDEAGRGPLAGPVVAAACMLPKGELFAHLNDSKKVSPPLRQKLFVNLTAHPLVAWGVGMASVEEIDRLNILQATLLAMHRAIEALPIAPDHLLIDGLHAPKTSIPASCLVQGDARSFSIAAASIFAKTIRDRVMERLDEVWGEYGFREHKGYGTEKHRKAIERYGRSPIHRMSFRTGGSLCVGA